MKLILTATYPQMLQVALQQIDRTRGQKTCIVVPDRFSLEAEEALLRVVGGTTFDVEVTTFARLADKLTSHDKTLLTKEGCAVVVASLMQAHADELQAFRGTACAGELYATIAQLAACGKMPEDLCYDGADALGRKIHDVRLIYSEYEQFLQKGYCDASSKMREAIRAVDTPWVRQTHFIFAGYDAVTGLNLSFVKALDKVAGKVIFCAADGDYLFGSTETQKRLAEIASEVITVAPEATPLRASFLAEFGNAVKKDVKTLVAGTNEVVRLHQASGGDNAYEHCAKTILGRVRRDGLRFKDIAVVTSTADEASRFLDAYAIPYNTDSVLNLSVHPLARVLADALECVVKHCATTMLARIAHNVLLGVSDEDFFAWDGYVRHFGLDHGAHGTPYTAILPQGVGKESERKQVESDRVRAEKVRACAMNVVAQIPTGRHRASVFADALKKLLSMLPKLSEVSALEEAYVAFDRQARERIEHVLDNLYFVDEFIDAEQCAKLLATGLLAADVRVTPTFVDAVNVFTPDSFGFGTYQLLIWLGADEGVLPAVQHDCGLLSDYEIDRLGELGVGINPKICEVNARARMRAFSTLFVSSEVTLITSGGAAQPNFAFRILRDEYGVPVTTAQDFGAYADGQESARQQMSCLFHAPDLRNAKRVFFDLYHRALSAGAETLCPAAESLASAAHITLADDTVQNVEQAEQVFFGLGQTSISQIEQYFSCPYRHFLAYGLRCKTRKEAKVKANDIGNVLHGVAEKFAAALPQNREDCDELCQKLTQEVLDENEVFGLRTADTSHERDVIFAESKVMCQRLYDFAQSTEFAFYGAEQGFGTAKAKFPALDVGVRLTGKIDRIDTCGDDVMIIDYKTGFTGFTYHDVFYGNQIQLFSYMRVLTKLGYHPSAAIFFPVRNDFSSNLTCTGWVSLEHKDLEKLDKAFRAQGSSGFMPVKFSRVDANTHEIVLSGAERALTQAQWEAWLGYTEKLLTQAVKEIKDGYVAPTPFASGTSKQCDHCDGAQSCPNAGRYGARVHNQTVKKTSIEKLMQEEVE